MRKRVKVGISDPETIITGLPPPKNIHWHDIELSDEYMDDEDGDGKPELHYQKGLTVKCLTPGLTAAISEGDTEDEALSNIIEAIQLVEEAKANG